MGIPIYRPQLVAVVGHKPSGLVARQHHFCIHGVFSEVDDAVKAKRGLEGCDIVPVQRFETFELTCPEEENFAVVTSRDTHLCVYGVTATRAEAHRLCTRMKQYRALLVFKIVPVRVWFVLPNFIYTDVFTIWSNMAFDPLSQLQDDETACETDIV